LKLHTMHEIVKKISTAAAFRSRQEEFQSRSE
jgi:hypothetical protein